MLVLRHFIAISLCAIVIHLVHDGFIILFLSLFLKDSLGVASSADSTQNEWIQRTNLVYAVFLIFLEKSRLYAFREFTRRLQKQSAKNNGYKSSCVYVFLVSIIIH